MGRDLFNYIRLLNAPSNPTLNTSTTSPGNLLHCFTTPLVKNFFFSSGLNLLSCNTELLLHVLS